MSFASQMDELRKAFTRAALVSIALLYFSLNGLETAYSRVNGDEVSAILDRLAGADVSGLEASYVFGARLDEIRFDPFFVPEPFDPLEPDAAPAAPPDLERVEADRALVAQAAADLETLAEEWFTVRVELLGTVIPLDLRLVAPLLPFLAMMVAAHLSITHLKVRALQATHGAAPARTGTGSGAAPAPLWDRVEFHGHPFAIIQLAVALGYGVLLVWVAVQVTTWSNLLSGDLLVDYRNAVICGGAFLVAYVVRFHRIVMPRPRASSGSGLLTRLGRWLAARGRTLVPGGPGGLRIRASSGALLVLATLPMTLATSSCDTQTYTGLEYLADMDAVWFNAIWPVIITDWVMRPLYVAMIVVSTGALAGVVLSWRPGAGAATWHRRLVGVASTIAAVTALLIFCSVAFFTRDDELRLVGDALATAVWLWVLVRLRAARHDPGLHRRRRHVLALALAPPALTFGIQAVGYLAANGLLAVLVLLAGCVISATAYAAVSARIGGDRSRLAPVARGDHPMAAVPRSG